MNIFKLEAYLAKYEFSAKYLLCCSDAESFTMSEIIGIASSKQMDLWQNLRLGYYRSIWIAGFARNGSREIISWAWTK